VRVLSGDGAATGGRPVVPPRATSVHVLLNSHGNAHPRSPEKVDVGRDEHYMLFPYPVPAEAEGLYDSVAWRGDTNVDATEPYGPRKYRWRLYSTMLFQALLSAQRAHPARTTVLLNQSCLSAAHARFLELDAFHEHFRTKDWPILHVSTAGPWEASISDLWQLWIDEWSHALGAPAARATLGEIFARAERRYWEKNGSLKEHNAHVMHAAPAFTPLSYGTVHMHEGRGKAGKPMRETVLWEMLIEEEGADDR